MLQQLWNTRNSVTVIGCRNMKKEIQLDATQWFIELTIRSTCFGHYYAHHQELDTYRYLQHVAHNCKEGTLNQWGMGVL
jgi:hypothetical protein